MLHFVRQSGHYGDEDILNGDKASKKQKNIDLDLDRDSEGRIGSG
jgi:hypothetical protein